MIFKSSWLSPRIPTAFLLLPILWFTLSISPNLNEWRSLWILIIVHFILFSAINAYTNYHDLVKVERYGFIFKRKISILLYASVILFIVAVILAFLKVNVLFASLVLLYGLVMLTYNHPSVDWKMNPIISWIVVSFFQGVVLVVIYYAGINKLPLDHILILRVLLPGIILSIFMAVFYPGTRIRDGAEWIKIFGSLKIIYTTILLL